MLFRNPAGYNKEQFKPTLVQVHHFDHFINIDDFDDILHAMSTTSVYPVQIQRMPLL